jgi:hypothetical protein
MMRRLRATGLHVRGARFQTPLCFIFETTNFFPEFEPLSYLPFFAVWEKQCGADGRTGGYYRPINGIPYIKICTTDSETVFDVRGCYLRLVSWIHRHHFQNRIYVEQTV